MHSQSKLTTNTMGRNTGVEVYELSLCLTRDTNTVYRNTQICTYTYPLEQHTNPPEAHSQRYIHADSL
jgi:hypothetical protein